MTRAFSDLSARADAAPRDFAAIVVSFNRAASLQALVEALGQNAWLRAIIVVDNGSDDNAAMVAESAGAQVIRLPGNVGYGEACNIGLRACTAEWVVICNDDIRPSEGALDMLVDAAIVLGSQHGRDVLVGPRLVDDRGNTAETGHRLPTLWRQALALMIGDGAAHVRNVLPAVSGGIHSCDWVSGTCIVARADALRRVGGFDSAYGMYVEDVDLMTRWVKSGRTVAWVPQAVVQHRGGRRPISPDLYVLCLRNWARYFQIYSGTWGKVIIMGASLVGVLMRLVYWGGRGFRSVEARGYARMFAACSGYLLTGRRGRAFVRNRGASGPEAETTGLAHGGPTGSPRVACWPRRLGRGRQ